MYRRRFHVFFFSLNNDFRDEQKIIKIIEIILVLDQVIGLSNNILPPPPFKKTEIIPLVQCTNWHPTKLEGLTKNFLELSMCVQLCMYSDGFHGFKRLPQKCFWHGHVSGGVCLGQEETCPGQHFFGEVANFIR